MATECLKKRPIKLKEPIKSKDRWITEISVPCGKCARCIQRRKMEWSFRMEKEMEISKTTYFITLTYDPKQVPYATTHYNKKTKLTEILKQYKTKTLNPDDLTKFFKKLRQNQKRTKVTWEHIYNNLKETDKIKYYAAGEYGENEEHTKRPHYHAIIFNASKKNIEKSWTKGSVHIVRSNKYTIAYVMKYLDKSIGKEKIKNKHPEFNTMSEGIGKNYIKKNKEWHKRNIDIMFTTINGGIKIPMSRYYRLNIFTEDERKTQVTIVEENLLDKKSKEIAKIGHEEWNNTQRKRAKESERRLTKKIKKRIID